MFDNVDDTAVHSGDSVVVKPGVEDPDMGDNLGGWQGRVVGIEENEGSDLMVDIAWDSLTLRAMAPEVIRHCERESLDWQVMTLSRDEVSLTIPRDTSEEVAKMRRELEQQYVIAEEDEEGNLFDGVEYDDPRSEYPGPLSALDIGDVRAMADSPLIFQRGEDYLQAGKVMQFAVSKQGIQARVRGSAGDYAVNVKDRLPEMLLYCDCPYEGEVCKHLVAVLLHYLKTNGTVKQDDFKTHVAGKQDAYAVPAAVRESLLAMSQQALVDLVLELAEERDEVLRSLMTRIRIAPETAARSPRNDAQVAAIKEQVASFFEELERQNEHEGEYDDWQREYDEHETYPELETTFAITRALYPDDRLEIYWYVLTCAEGVNQEYALGTPQIIEAITAYTDTASEIAHTHAEKRAYVEALVGLLDWSIGHETSVKMAIKQALEHLCGSDEEIHDLIDILTQEDEASNADWIAGYYRQLGEDAQYLRVREAHLQREEQFLELADYWLQCGEPERARETLERWITRRHEAAEHAAPGIRVSYGLANHGVFARLETLYRAQNDPENLYRILRAREQAQGITLQLYQEIAVTAKALGRWSEIQPQLLQHAKFSRQTLVGIYLYEQDWDAAISLANATTAEAWDTTAIRAQVACGVQRHRPEAALALYRAIVEASISRAKREAYAIAADYAVAIRDIYRTILHDEAGWQEYIATLLARNARRRALQEEFRKVV
jgi:uncharacterized Zn finger protein